MEIQLFGAAKIVTGSCYSITAGKHKILVDCGMFQGDKNVNRKNYKPFGFNPKAYSALLLTHAHLDHCGRVPKLVKEGFVGPIYSTEPTRELAKIIMLDAADIQKYDTKHENKRRKRKKLSPRDSLFTKNDVKDVIKLFKIVEYEQEVIISENIKATFYCAGHILGASSIKITVSERNKITDVIFSGDIGQYGTPIIKDPHVMDTADYLFIESTYGDREHFKRERGRKKLLEIIKDVYNKGGKLMIPSFAIERTQELLYDLNELFEKKLVPKVPVFIDSPMAIEATKVFEKYHEFYDKNAKKLLKVDKNLFVFPELKYSLKVQDSIAINSIKKSCIIIAGSGMCTAGRIKHHIKHNISDPKNTILFVGYQVPGTLGYYIKSGAEEVKLLGKRIPVRAKVESIDSFSGHADYHGLLAWFKPIRPFPKKVFITHGDKEAVVAMAERIQNLGVETYVPQMNEKLHLK